MVFNSASAWHWLYWLLAMGGSLFYGIKACEVFNVALTGNESLSWRVHQFWFNFVGALTGWLAAWPLVGALAACASVGCVTEISASSVALFVLAFLGVTGHLPVALVGLIGGLKELVTKLLSAAGGKP